MNYEESIVGFGREEALVGILTEPGEGAVRARVGCLLLNTGMNYRVGQRRINVKLARRLAASGIPSLRFDMSGLGDSKASSSRDSFRQQQSNDMSAALDQFQASTGLRKFLVFGVCSGADNALSIGLVDSRVVGVLLFDGPDFLSKRVRAVRKLHRMAAFPFNAALRHQNAAWRALTAWLRSPLDASLGRQFLARLRKSKGAESEVQADIFATNAPAYTAKDYAAELQSLLDRGVDVYVMFSAMLHAADRNMGMLAQLRGEPCLKQIRYRFWPDIDHTATLLDGQRRLLDAVDEWAVEVAGSVKEEALPLLPSMRASSGS